MHSTLDPAESFAQLRSDWTTAEVLALWEQPFNDLLFVAHAVHRKFWPANAVQKCTLLSIKTGSCPEDCKYCPQSARYNTGLKSERLMEVEAVLAGAREAKAQGATRYCMGAAWRNPRGEQFEQVLTMVREVRALGMETCATLGMLEPAQAEALREAGLDYYNHNIDSSEAFYREIISTRTFGDRMETLAAVRQAGIHVCSGGIVGMGESRLDRVEMLRTLATLETHPESVPINLLVQVPGTPLHGIDPLDPLEFVRTVAVARLLMPASYVRLSAGRETMSDELQAMCYFAGANSVFFGPRLLTTPNPEADRDAALFARLGIEELDPASVPSR
jgi:biotin synthase